MEMITSHIFKLVHGYDTNTDIGTKVASLPRVRHLHGYLSYEIDTLLLLKGDTDY